MHKDLYILGINEALNAAAALLKNGRVIAAAQEERFTRIKNQSGFPKRAVRFCCDTASINSCDIDLVILSYTDPYPHFTYGRAIERSDLMPHFLQKIRDSTPHIEYRIPALALLTRLGRSLYYHLFQTRNQNRQRQEIAHELGISQKKILRLDHHLAHAWAGYLSQPQRKFRQLVFTCDGAGDQLCATVSIAQNGKLKRIAQTPHHSSPGLFYAAITGHLGFRAHEDEYKIMGLAPYATNQETSKLIRIFESLLWVHGFGFSSAIPSWQYPLFLEEKLRGYRFDHIAFATQLYFENLMTTWISNAIAKTHIYSLILSGGAFLNVKANMLIAKLPAVKKLFIMPSPGDDSTAFGTAFWGHQKMVVAPDDEIQSLHSLYLGPGFTESTIEKILDKYPSLSATRPRELIKKTASLLANGTIVAKFSGQMEFGARALGNRSILADPRNVQVVELLNRAIKQRDFWMPFAATILADKAEKYIKNEKHLSATYMIMAFETTELGKKLLSAAVHPYDKTIRPQLLRDTDNPEFYKLIAEFEKLTGVAALLNTSFNLHGEPIVCSPQDALSTFMRSGLTHLILEDYLVCKQ